MPLAFALSRLKVGRFSFFAVAKAPSSTSSSTGTGFDVGIGRCNGPEEDVFLDGVELVACSCGSCA